MYPAFLDHVGYFRKELRHQIKHGLSDVSFTWDHGNNVNEAPGLSLIRGMKILSANLPRNTHVGQIWNSTTHYNTEERNKSKVFYLSRLRFCLYMEVSTQQTTVWIQDNHPLYLNLLLPTHTWSWLSCWQGTHSTWYIYTRASPCCFVPLRHPRPQSLQNCIVNPLRVLTQLKQDHLFFQFSNGFTIHVVHAHWRRRRPKNQQPGYIKQRTTL